MVENSKDRLLEVILNLKSFDASVVNAKTSCPNECGKPKRTSTTIFTLPSNLKHGSRGTIVGGKPTPVEVWPDI